MMLKIIIAVLVIGIIFLAAVIFTKAIKQKRGLGWKNNLTGMVIGLITDFLDTLGIGSFETTPALYQITHYLDDDRDLPGTLNMVHSIPTMIEALVFVTAVHVQMTTLVPMVVAAVIGALIGSEVVVRMETTLIQRLMAGALIITSMLMLANKFGWVSLLATHNNASGLHGWALVIGVVGNFILGMLMSAGVGMYAPCMVLVYFLGLKPIAAFPIMMLSCALLMPIVSLNFIRNGRYSLKGIYGFLFGGLVGVFIATHFVKNLSFGILEYLIVIVCLWTAYQLFRSSVAAKEDFNEKQK